MVLPTLHSHAATKHLTDPQEIMQTKQEIEIEKKVERPQTANSIKAQARQNSAHSKWASPISGTLNDEALRIEQEQKEKSNRLEQRRGHLSAILEAEKNKFQSELISHRQSSRESIPQMKTRPDSLRSVREKEHQITTDENVHQVWITNNHDLHSIEQQKLENLQPDYWSEQLTEKRFMQEEDSLKYQQEVCQPLYEQNKQEQEGQKERKTRSQQLKMILQQQMDEFNQKEEESEILKQDEERLLKEQWILDQLKEERKQIEKCYIQQDHGRQLLRQHKAKLHKRAKEIQEQLQVDIKILTRIAHADKESLLEQSEQREELKRNALNILKQFQQQIKLEKEKENEIDDIYQEEAAKQWSRREQQWNHDKESREKLMRQLLDERQEQINEKLKALKEQQKEIDERQRILIDDIEQARKYDLIEKQKQISILQKEREKSRLELEKQDAIGHEDNKQIDQLVQKQNAVITTTTVQPKFYGRRRLNWN